MAPMPSSSRRSFAPQRSPVASAPRALELRYLNAARFRTTRLDTGGVAAAEKPEKTMPLFLMQARTGSDALQQPKSPQIFERRVADRIAERRPAARPAVEWPLSKNSRAGLPAVPPHVEREQ